MAMLWELVAVAMASAGQEVPMASSVLSGCAPLLLRALALEQRDVPLVYVH